MKPITTLRRADVPQLCCPSCRGELLFRGDEVNELLLDGTLRCAGCSAAWPVVAGVPRLFREELIKGNDRLLRVLYDALGAFHDPLTTLLTPFLAGMTERQGRDMIMQRIRIGEIEQPKDRPIRILEVGVGGGANLPLLRRELAGRDAEIWGIDLSSGMLAECAVKVEKQGYGEVRLLLGDAHSLPFADGSFDRVFHVGGIGGYRDPRAALAEMARVAVPRTPIVVVDEQLDRGRKHSLLHRAAFRAVTFYERDPKSPRDLLPKGAVDVLDEQPSRIYYCLSFRVAA